ncbi:MAG: iron ABC transporter permease [Gammaproteobacteria bacterium]
MHLTMGIFAMILVGSLVLMVGAVPLDWTQLLAGDSQGQTILWQLRLPRVLLAGLVGGGLALAGACVQGLFRNPLADPTLIGVAGGAALAAAICIAVAPLLLANPWWIAGAAFLGGLTVTFLVLAISGRETALHTLLLAGLAVNAVSLALVGLIGVLVVDESFRSIAFWTLGSLNHATWQEVVVALLMLPLAWRLIYRAEALNAMVLSEHEFSSLGFSSQLIRREVIVLVAAMTGIAVSLTGVIAFVGLIVPHMARIAFGAMHQTLLPLAFMMGAMLMMLADAASRTLIAPMEIPIGIITALIGAPVFIALLRKQVVSDD